MEHVGESDSTEDLFNNLQGGVNFAVPTDPLLLPVTHCTEGCLTNSNATQPLRTNNKVTTVKHISLNGCSQRKKVYEVSKMQDQLQFVSVW